MVTMVRKVRRITTENVKIGPAAFTLYVNEMVGFISSSSQ